MRKYIPAFVIAIAVGLISLGTVAQGGEKTSEVSIEGMICEACVNKVESAVKKVDGVKAVNVDLKTNSAQVTFASTANMASVEQAVADAGYTVKTAEAQKTMKSSEGATCGASKASAKEASTKSADANAGATCSDKSKASAKETGKEI
ncbi:MAG: heavy-metal-associated domain-containing protein [Candidatus Marinimicrobia bacterium]|nr:heavy-metal-associated domain-containing protein [Candidatus Neomarinimicrobiota bacterium]MCF7829172.1 heavy-metal-associated domain-containing protein [Candidatus Neomarinimicrobiota bacterium]MCF7881175.1 heavy-metal-associated domain-containing protein [Candidatus Neomarinimicrobiota bacterium]